jgi:serine/threonine protein kinase
MMLCAGKQCPVSCKLAYAPPEAIDVHNARAELTVDPSLDMWAVGVILYECLSGSPAFTFPGIIEEVFECARGEGPYPWERPAEELPEGWRKSKARSFFQARLTRDPTARPSAKQLLSSMHRLSSSTYTARP